MTAPVKLLLSLVCLITAAGADYILSGAGKTEPTLAVAFLGIITAVAVWVFADGLTKSQLRRNER
jgi:hypothetical protein